MVVVFIQIIASLTSKKVDCASPMSRDAFHPCRYARSMKANLLDDGIGDTLASPAFDDVTLSSHCKRVKAWRGKGNSGYCPKRESDVRVGQWSWAERQAYR